MSEITTICETIAIKPADLKAINAARKSTEGINQTITRILYDKPHAARAEHFSWLHHNADAMEAVMIDNPTHENAEAFHAALVRFDQAKGTAQRIGESLAIALQKVSQSIAPIVSSLLDQVQATITEAGEKRAAELSVSDNSLFSNDSERQAVQSKIAKLLAELEATRKEAASDPLGFLEREGLALPE